MKKPIYLILIFLCAFLFSCSLWDELEEGKCEDGYLSCDNGKCCRISYPYTDSHGTCWETLNGCRQTGYACQKCW